MKTTFTKVLLAVAVLLGSFLISSAGPIDTGSDIFDLTRAVEQFGAANYKSRKTTEIWKTIVEDMQIYAYDGNRELPTIPIRKEWGRDRVYHLASLMKKKHQANLLRLFFHTGDSIPSQVDDGELVELLGKGGKKVIRQVRETWRTNQAIRVNLKGLLEHYAPEEAAALVEVITAPYYEAPMDYIDVWQTDASEVLWYVDHEANKLGLLAQSTIGKLLLAEGYIKIPKNIKVGKKVVAKFEAPEFKKRDIAALKLLVKRGNSHYTEMAQRWLDKLNPPSPPE